MQDDYKLSYASYLEGLTEEERELELQKNQPKKKGTVKAESKPAKKKPTKINSTSINFKSSTGHKENLNLYKGEPEPPPV